MGACVKTEVPLAHFEANGSDGKGSVVSVVDDDFDSGGALEIRADGCRDAKLLLADLAASLGKMDSLDGAEGVFAGESRGAFRTVKDVDVTTEVDFEGRSDVEGDAFHGDTLRKQEGSDALASMLGNCGRFDCGGIERLGFATGCDGGSENNPGSGAEGAGAGRGDGREGDVEVREGGLLERERGVVGEMLSAEIKEGKLAEERGRVAAGMVGARDSGGGDVVLAGEVEGDLGVGARGHLEVEHDAAVAGAEVEDAGGGTVGLDRLAEGDGVGDLLRALLGDALIEAEVFERRRGVSKDGGIEDSAGLALSGGEADAALVTKIVRVAGLNPGGSDGLPEEKHEES